MEITHAVYLVPPYHGGGKREIVSQPKCYAFDTGFVTFEKGWETLRAEDRGLLWEHLTLDSLRFYYPHDRIFYWRDKSHREVDFVIPQGRDSVDLLECKINPDKLEPGNAITFRAIYPAGKNYVVSPLVNKPYKIRKGGLVFTICSTNHLGY